MAEVRSVRYNTTGSRILSDRDISRPDLEIELNNQMANDFVKIEDHKKQIDAIQIALGARMRRSFIAGAIFGTLILVAIIMAGVGLQKEIQPKFVDKKLPTIQEKFMLLRENSMKSWNHSKLN